MIDIFNSVIRRLFDYFFTVFRLMNPWVVMTALSLVTAVLLLLNYRAFSNQQRIREVKARIFAHLLEMRLYSSSLSITMRAQGNILWNNLIYLGHSARPILVMIIPLGLAIIQIDQWLGYQPLNPGETAVFKVQLNEGIEASHERIFLNPSAGLALETPPLRIDKGGEIDWRLRAMKTGYWDVTFSMDDQTVAKRVVIGRKSLARISTSRVDGNWISQLENPGESAISKAPGVKSIEVSYPPRRMAVFGWNIHWLIVYLALSIAFSFLLKPLFKIEL